MLACFFHRSRRRLHLVPLLVLSLICFSWWRFCSVLRARQQIRDFVAVESITYIDNGVGDGGRWYIPEAWFVADAHAHDEPLLSNRHPRNVLEAAQLALELAVRNGKYAANTNIPLITHQTYKNLVSSSWKFLIRTCVETWLDTATSGHPDMAYILWDDAGVAALIRDRESVDFQSAFAALPLTVEKADTFRVAVLRWFGGFYADVDTVVLKHPASWVPASDMKPWEDARTGQVFDETLPYSKSFIAPTHSSHSYQTILSRYEPSQGVVSAIFGIEADTDPTTDAYWRMGYFYPVQLTNWALAMAPQHPISIAFLRQLQWDISRNLTRLAQVNPLELTGPPAITKIVKAYAEQADDRLAFEAVTGLHDAPGGRGKIVAGDVLILPITGFSPGRGWMDNMGSQPVTHPNARLRHNAAGSWKNFTLKVHAGKLCRKLFGLCRDWSSVP